MSKPQPASRNIDNAVTRSVNFELTLVDLVRRSERRAWTVAMLAMGVALLLAGGCFYMLPLKQQVPYLVVADAASGTSSLARLLDDPTHRRISANEAINRSHVAHYVTARESYDLAMLNLSDWTTVQTMSAPGVRAAYTRLYATANPENLVKLYGKDTAIRIRLLSTVLIGGGSGAPAKGATVRFQRSSYNKQTGVTHPLDNKIATLGFTYRTNLQMDEPSRIANPLGFWVTDYRVDNDYATAPPAAVEAPSVGAWSPTPPPLSAAQSPDDMGTTAATAIRPADRAVPARAAPAGGAHSGSGTGGPG